MAWYTETMKDSRWQTYTKPRREANKAYILSKKDCPCADCGQSYPSCVMDFHHLDEGSKDETLKPRGLRAQSMLEQMSKWGKKRIDAELEKCVVLCANCHRLRHMDD